MKIAICNIFLLVFVITFISYAQDNRQIQKTEDIKEIQLYLNKVADYSIIYSGRVEEPYFINLTNHPYFNKEKFSTGVLCYNDIVYTDIKLRYNLHREDILVEHPGLLFGIELKKENVSWFTIDGYRVVASKKIDWENVPDARFLILLHEGMYPVVQTSKSALLTNYSNRVVEYYFDADNRYYICISGICYPLKSKKSLLNLFPDQRRELDQYAKQKRLDFKRNPETAYVELVEYYERLNR